ncbi:MAG: hypothetical protein HOO06_05280 [Bdellovibrionaceae bacterium]|nr:hypothetical protein [Pseudobdellovibrionaceae bacterium]
MNKILLVLLLSSLSSPLWAYEVVIKNLKAFNTSYPSNTNDLFVTSKFYSSSDYVQQNNQGLSKNEFKENHKILIIKASFISNKALSNFSADNYYDIDKHQLIHKYVNTNNNINLTSAYPFEARLYLENKVMNLSADLSLEYLTKDKFRESTISQYQALTANNKNLVADSAVIQVLDNYNRAFLYSEMAIGHYKLNSQLTLVQWQGHFVIKTSLLNKFTPALSWAVKAGVVNNLAKMIQSYAIHL